MKSVCLAAFILLLAVSLYARDAADSSVALTSGITVDVAPFGIEQVYFTAEGAWIVEKEGVFLSAMPSFSVNRSSMMVRVPFVIGLYRYAGLGGKFMISGYAGGGLEVYSSLVGRVYSPLLICGIFLKFGVFCINIPAVSALRYYNTDSDIGITAGFSFPVL